MEESLFQNIVNAFLKQDGNHLRDKAAKNKSLRIFLSSQRFLTEYAKRTGRMTCLPPAEYLEKQMRDGFLPFRRHKNRFDLQEIVFDKTRHGFLQIDFPIDANHGAHADEDTGDCVAPCQLRNIFILENMNIPVCRFDPLMFCQSWVLTLLRPKFVFRGMVACPKGDYGLARMIVEVGSGKRQLRSETSIAFKNGEDEKLGRFIPFEVSSPDYDFRPTYIFFFFCIFYVNRTKIEKRGMRIANCSVQCVLPPMPDDLNKIECSEGYPAEGYDSPLYNCEYTANTHNDPEYLVSLKQNFFSVLENAKGIRDADTERTERVITEMLGGNLMGDPMEIGVDNGDEKPDSAEKRSHSQMDQEDDEPAMKRMR